MASGTTAQQTIDVVTPAAGESVTEGTILEWHAKVGDSIALDATIVEISTDKVDVELPSPASGTVSEILVEEGETVTVGQVIARIAVGAADGAAAASGTGNGSGAAKQSSDAVPDDLKISPVAARAAAAEGVDLARVSGSGPAGRITKSDVLSAASGNGAAHGTADGNDASTPSAAAKPNAQLMKGGAAASPKSEAAPKEKPGA